MQLDTGFHMDAVKFANWLKDKYCLPKGVVHQQAYIVNYKQFDNGYLEYIQDDEGNKYYADLFVDCTGFKSYLIKDVMNTGWEQFDDILLNDSAWAVRLPYTNKREQLKNYTNCTALSSGWVWNVPLRNRMGTGYNYSSKFISDEDALTEFKNHLGNPTETLCEYRNIKFKTGLSEKIWNKNVLAIGLSAGFIEPLESNGLLSVHNFLVWACEVISSGNKINTMNINAFNYRAKSFFKVFAYFVAFHYGLSTRSDSPYWKYITEEYDWLSKLKNEEIYSLGESVTPLDKFDLDKWTYYNFGGTIFIAAGHDYNPFSPVTLKLLHNRGQIDLESFRTISYPEDTYQIQETFPIASDYYEN